MSIDTATRQRIAEAVREAFAAYGGRAENPYPEHTDLHLEWDAALKRAMGSDELEGSAL